MKHWGVVVGGILAVTVLAGCSAESSVPAETVELKTASMAFSSKEVTVKKGTPVMLVLNNSDSLLHDFSIDKIPAKVAESKGDDHGEHGTSAGVHVAADAGKSGSVEFTPTEAGVYTFYCTVPGHKEAGMVGQLIVQ